MIMMIIIMIIMTIMMNVMGELHCNNTTCECIKSESGGGGK
jgi:hypothetical protein